MEPEQASDISRHYYWRQLRDTKGSPEVDSMAPVTLNFYAGICGWTRGGGSAFGAAPTNGMTAGCRCVVGEVRNAL